MVAKPSPASERPRAPEYGSALFTHTPGHKTHTVNPETHLPHAFRVGSKEVSPVVTIHELVHHLTFLACLHRLQQDVRECPTPEGAGDQLSGDVKWAAFCARAALRFEEWALRKGRPPKTDLDGVDIDVLMVWHTYMLNPTDFEGDRWRLNFKLPSAFPLAEVASRIDKGTYVYQPFQLVPVEPGKGGGDTDFVPPPPAYETHPRSLIEIDPMDTRVSIRCHYCQKELSVPLVGTLQVPGYATANMAVNCRNCRRNSTHERLKIRRLCNDLMGARLQLVCLAGLSDARFRAYAHKLSQLLAVGMREKSATEMGDAMGWQFANIRDVVLRKEAMRPIVKAMRTSAAWGSDPPTLRRNMRSSLSAISRAYAETELSPSLDLAAAVQRQASFVSSMERIGWLDMERWELGAYYLLQKAVARYHAFLDLMSVNRSAFLSPTLDIDLAWHTHQLQGKKYETETVKLVGQLLSHDDKVADVRLKMAYDQTAELWAKRFGVPYSGCGCPVPHKAYKGLEKNLARRFKADTGMKFWKRAEAERQGAAEGKQYVNQLLARQPEEERNATCPSTHNLLHVNADGKTEASLRLIRRQLAIQLNDEGHENPFATRYVFVPRRVRGTRSFGPPEPLARRDERSERRRRDQGTNEAFIYGVPLYWGLGAYGYGGYAVGDPWSCSPDDVSCGRTGCAAGMGAAGSGACVTSNSNCAGAGGMASCGTGNGGCVGASAGGCAGGSSGGACGGGG